MLEIPKSYEALDKTLRLWAAKADPEAYCGVLKGNRREELLKLAENANQAEKDGTPYETYAAETLLPRLGLPPMMMDLLLSQETMSARGFINPLMDMLTFSDEDDTPPLGMPPIIAVPVMLVRAAVVDIKLNEPPDEHMLAKLERLSRLKAEMPDTLRMSLVADVNDIPLDADEETLRAWIRANVSEPQETIATGLPMMPFMGGIPNLRAVDEPQHNLGRLARLVRNALRRTPPQNRDLDFYDHLGVSQYNVDEDTFVFGDEDDTEE